MRNASLPENVMLMQVMKPITQQAHGLLQHDTNGSRRL